MSERTITIPYGGEERSFRVPAECVEGVFSPRRATPLRDISGALSASLEQPHGCERLRDMLRTRAPARVVIVIDDLTRPTPVHLVLAPILDYCNQAGVPDDRIKVVIALGTHRPMTRDEIIGKCGQEACDRVPCINPHYDSPEDLVSYGTSRSGMGVWINKTYAEAEFSIAIGAIVPHAAVGFSGGAKMICPGIAGRETVEAFHQIAGGNPENAVGKETTPARQEIEEIVELVGLDFLLVILTDSAGGVAGLTAGHYIQAHREGVKLSRDIYGIPLQQRVRIAVASAYPADLDLWQAAKSLFNCHAAVEDNGWLVMVTPCPEGIPPEHALFDSYIGMEASALVAGLQHGSLSDPTTAAPAQCLARIRKRVNVAIVSHGLSRPQVERMGCHYFASVDEAIHHIFLHSGKEKIAVFTHGGESFPFIA